MKLYEKAFIKNLTSSEINSLNSTQHELHGVSKLEAIFGAKKREKILLIGRSIASIIHQLLIISSMVLLKKTLS